VGVAPRVRSQALTEVSLEQTTSIPDLSFGPSRQIVLPRVHRIVFGALLALLVWAPIPLASNRVFAGSFLAAALIGLLAVLVLADSLSGRLADSLSRLHSARWPIFTLLGIAALMAVQQLLPFAWGGSADAYRTKFYLLLTLGYTSAFILVRLLLVSGPLIRVLVWALVISATAQAFVGILLHAGQVQYQFLFFDISHQSRAMGSFSYHNSLANYILIGASLGLGLLFGQVIEDGPGPRVGFRRQLLSAMDFVLSPAMRLRLMLVILVIGLILTKSRMGNAAFLAALLIVFLPVLVAAGRIRWKGMLLLASILVVDLVIIGQMIGFDRVTQRLEQTAIFTEQAVDQGLTDESVEHRTAPGRQALAMLADRPVLGFGAGAFYTAYPQYNPPEIRLYYDHAHNDIAQIAAEMGGIGFALFAGLVALTVFRAVQVVRKPYGTTDRGLALGGLMAVLAVLMQATVDFHFQIPANALTFVVVLGLIWSLRRAQPRGNHEGSVS
jgi:O-antigen ligase